MHIRIIGILVVILAVLCPQGEAVEITLLDYGDTVPGVAELWREVDKAFSEEYPDVTIKRETIVSQQDFIDTLFVRVLAGMGPDIIPGVMRWAPIFMEAGLAVGIANMIEETPWIDLDDWYPVAREWGQYKGVLYSLPTLNLDVGITVFRQDAFQEAGLLDPFQLSESGQWNWRSLESIAKQLTMDLNGDGRIDQYGYHGPFRTEWAWMSLVYSNGGEVLSPDFSESRLHEPAAYEALQWWFDLKHVHGVWGDWDNYVWRGESGGAAIATGAIYHAQMTHQAGYRTDIAPMPDAKSGYSAVHVPFTGGSMILNNGDSERIEAAWDYIAFQLRPENRWIIEKHMELTGRLPAMRTFMEDWTYIYSEFVEHPEVVFSALMSSKKEPYNPYWPRIRELIIDGINILWSGDIPASHVMADVSTRINAILNE